MHVRYECERRNQVRVKPREQINEPIEPYGTPTVVKPIMGYGVHLIMGYGVHLTHIFQELSASKICPSPKLMPGARVFKHIATDNQRINRTAVKPLMSRRICPKVAISAPNATNPRRCANVVANAKAMAKHPTRFSSGEPLPIESPADSGMDE